ncbi:MAG: biotin--[acetyl-CoA-carboxylase] ligase [Clostridia bacterium]|nr:biotin--[acetyl-CoA-carboxylase] ligase [Clostridia bacterium]
MSESCLDADIISGLLNGGLGISVSVYDCVSSTNALGKSLPAGVPPTVIVAREQTAGRGRFDRRFDSARDAGLYMSICYTPKKSLTPSEITAAAGVAVCLAIERQTGESPKIKWVNDIYFENKKLAGILAEGVFSEDGSLSRAIVGIGINVRKRKFPREIEGIATSLEDAYGRAVDINRLCADTVNLFFSLTEHTPRAMSLYKSLSLVIGRHITVHTQNGCYGALAQDIDDSGSLVVLLEDGEIQKICSGEISIRLA